MSTDKTARHHRPAAREAKRQWTDAETQAVKDGVERWGKGKWSNIKDDPDFGPILVDRTTMDIKDKYRNMQKRKRTAGETSSPPPTQTIHPPLQQPTQQLRPIPTTTSIKTSSAAAAAAVPRRLQPPQQQYQRHQPIPMQTLRSSPHKKVKELNDHTNKIKKDKLDLVNVSRKNEEERPHHSGLQTLIAQLPQTTMTTNHHPSSSSSASSATTTSSSLKQNCLMTLTLNNGSKSEKPNNLVVQLHGSTKASTLLDLAVKEFRLEKREYGLFSQGTSSTLNLNKSVQDQVPMFDLIQVINM